MKYSLLFALGLLAATPLFSQQKCDSANLQADKVQLQRFWTAFKDAVNRKDKVKLSNLIFFPFTCDYCIIDSNKRGDKPRIKVTKTTFDKSQYKIFFSDRLVKEINKHNLPQDLFIFQPYYNIIYKHCAYSFQYIEIKENDKNPGMQRFLDIRKVNGTFKIVSAWTLP